MIPNNKEFQKVVREMLQSDAFVVLLVRNNPDGSGSKVECLKTANIHPAQNHEIAYNYWKGLLDQSLKTKDF